MVLKGIRTSIAEKPYFCDFSGGGGGGPDPLFPSGSAHVRDKIHIQSNIISLFKNLSIIQVKLLFGRLFIVHV